MCGANEPDLAQEQRDKDQTVCGANRPDPAQEQRGKDRTVCGANRPDPLQGQRNEGRTVCGTNSPDPSQGHRDEGRTVKAPRPTSEPRHRKARSAGDDSDEVARARARLADEILAGGQAEHQRANVPAMVGGATSSSANAETVRQARLPSVCGR